MNAKSEESQASMNEAIDDITDDDPSSIVAVCQLFQGQTRECDPSEPKAVKVELNDTTINKTSKSVSSLIHSYFTAFIIIITASLSTK